MNPDIVGYIGGLLIAVSLVPQAWKSWKSKSTEDISLMWTIVYSLGIALYVVYAALVSVIPLLIFGAVELLLALSLLYLKLRHG